MYLLFKSLHLISVISWMAGLLYLPRIFVYHSENNDNQNTSEIFKTMEKKLFNYIMMPAMILSWLFGLLLVSFLGFSVFSEIWMQLKLIFVLLLTFYHFYLGRWIHGAFDLTMAILAVVFIFIFFPIAILILIMDLVHTVYFTYKLIIGEYKDSSGRTVRLPR